MTRSAEIVKFPIGRVVREHRITQVMDGSPESVALSRALRSVSRAIETMQRQRASLMLRLQAARARETPEQHEASVKKNMAHIYAREAEDRAAARAVRTLSRDQLQR